MKIVIAGGKGYLGKVLEKYFTEEEIVILTRKPEKNNHIYWDGKSLGKWQKALDKADVLINLAGKSVDCRYSPNNKQQILDSRLQSTRILGEALQHCNKPPSVWINASSATIYQHSINQPMDEKTGKIGDDFSMNVCKAWENEFFKNSLTNVRQIAIRTAIVIGEKSAAFGKLKWLSLLGMGGKSGTGRQMISWLHEEDFARALAFIITQPSITGVVNVSAPYPIENYAFMKNLRIALGMPLGIPQPKWLIKIGAWLLGTESELVLKSRFVVPDKLMKAGFIFKYRRVSAAFKAILKGKIVITPRGWAASAKKDKLLFIKEVSASKYYKINKKALEMK
jgi:uncharacterized protein